MLHMKGSRSAALCRKLRLLTNTVNIATSKCRKPSIASPIARFFEASDLSGRQWVIPIICIKCPARTISRLQPCKHSSVPQGARPFPLNPTLQYDIMQEEVSLNKQRRQRLAEAIRTLERVISVLEDARDQEQDGFDNLPDNLQETERAQSMEEAIDQLTDAIENIQEASECIQRACDA